jgi:HAD superfamily hydrolase (TIGR01509 family)
MQYRPIKLLPRRTDFFRLMYSNQFDSMISCILWDNDGVLVDTERLYFEVNRDCLRQHQIELSEQNFFDWFLCKNHGAWHLLTERGVAQDDIARYRQQRNELYTARLLSEKIPAIPGMPHVLAALAPRTRMGIVTSARREHFEVIHQRLDLLRHFEFVLTSESYQHSKPSPEPYLLGLKQLDTAAENCIVVEDSPRGLQAALAAGLRCIVLRNALMRDFPFTGAYRIVDSAEALLTEIEALL